jgi:hypothetical protein
MENSIFKECSEAYQDACKTLNKEPLTMEDFSPKLTDDKKQYLLSVERVTTVIEAKKEGHKFDYNDDDEYKYYPWWDMETYGDAAAGSGFSLGVVYCAYTATDVGARLSSMSETDARQIAKVMHEDYRVIMKQQ